MTNGPVQRQGKDFLSSSKFANNLSPLSLPSLLCNYSAIWAKAPPRICRNCGQGWGDHWFSTSLQFVASLKSSCCLWSEIFWANEYQQRGWDFGWRWAAANSLPRGDSAGRILARLRFSCSTSPFSLRMLKWWWSRGTTELLYVSLLLAWGPWEGGRSLSCLALTLQSFCCISELNWSSGKCRVWSPG